MKLPPHLQPWMMLACAALFAVIGWSRDERRAYETAGWGNYVVAAILVAAALYLFWRNRAR